MKLSEYSALELLRLQASIIDELKGRGIARTRNNPIGDYTEWIVARGLNLELASNSSAGYDGIDTKGTKFQIKGRRITHYNKSRQLSVIRKLDEKLFDKLAGVIFDERYNIIEAIVIPYGIVCKYAVYRKNVNGHILHLRGPILDDPQVKSIKEILRL